MRLLLNIILEVELIQTLSEIELQEVLVRDQRHLVDFHEENDGFRSFLKI